MTAAQRLEPVAAGGQIHDQHHQADTRVGCGAEIERQKCEGQRTLASSLPAGPLQRPVSRDAGDSRRPIPAHRRAPKLSDDRCGTFTFRIYEAAVRGLRRSAKTGPWRPAQNSPCGPAMDDWFTAANLNSALARPGQQRALAIGVFLAVW